MKTLRPLFILILLILPAVVTAGGGDDATTDYETIPVAIPGINSTDLKRIASDKSIRELVESAWNAVVKERYDSAAVYYSIAASRYSESLSPRDARRCALACVNMGYIWLTWRTNAAEAYPWLMRADAIAERHDIPDIHTAVLSNLGQIYFDYNNMPKAREYLLETFRRVAKERDPHYYGRALVDFVTAALYDDRREIPQDIIDIIPEDSLGSDVPFGEYIPAMGKALRLFKMNKYEEAATTLENAGTLINLESDSKRYKAQHYLCVAQMWMEAGNYKRAAEALEKVIGYASGEGFYNLLEKGYANMEICKRHTGSPDEAEKYHLRVLSIRDSLFNASRFEAVKDLEISGQLNSLHDTVRRASADAELQKRRIWIISGVAVILIALLLWIYTRHRRLREAYREIFKRNMELSERSATDTDCHDTASADSTEQRVPVEVPSAESMELLARIKDFLSISREIFNPDFNIEKMATMLDSREKLISQTINQLTGKNFNTLLSEYRIREACRLLGNPDTLRSATMESVAESVGYRSRTHFSSIFKTVTGLTPTQFVKQARSLHG